MAHSPGLRDGRACIGSFLNVVIYRVPLGISINDPARSFCPECDEPIPWYLNIPVFSWLFLRGKSACCRTPISFRYWLVELLTALIFAAMAWKYADASPGRRRPALRVERPGHRHHLH